HRPNGAHMRPPLRSSGPRSHGNSMRPLFRPVGHRPHGPSMNLRRPTMNGARPYKTFFQTPSFETRPFLKSSALNNSYRAPWVPTVNSGNPNSTTFTFNPSAEQMETLTVESPIPTVSLPVLTACLNDSSKTSSEARLVSKRVANQEETPSLDNILSLTNRIVPLFDTMLVHQGKGSGTPTEPHHIPFPEVESSHPTTLLIPLPSIPTAPIPTITHPDPTPIRQYSRRARIAQSSALPIVADEAASLVRDVSEGEACPTESGFIADQDRATIGKTSTLPHDSAPRVTSPAADEL
nr:hypothetical protein [Tanacetum cinerariifolium]